MIRCFWFAWLTVAVCGSGVFALERAAAVACHQAARQSIRSYPYAAGDYLFLQVEGRYDDDDDSEMGREMAEMEALHEAAGKYLLADVRQHRFEQSPFGQKMTRLLVPQIYFNFRFSGVRSTVVAEKAVSKGFSRILAFDRAGMEKLRQQHLFQAEQEINKMSRKEWGGRLKHVYHEFRTPAERRTFVQLLGCPVVLLMQTGSGHCDLIQDEVAQAGAAELAKFLSSVPEQGHFFQIHAGAPWKQVWATKGNATFSTPKPQGSTANAPEADVGNIEQARKMRESGDFQSALQLLVKDIEANPCAERLWRTLGKTLEMSGQYTDALVAYLQARHLGADERKVLKAAERLCAKCGMKTNADGLKWYLEMLVP